MESAAARTSVWWDIENCHVPRGWDAHSVAHNIGEALARAGYGGVVTSISAYGDTAKVSAAVQHALSSTGVSLNHVPPGVKDLTDKKILVDMLIWAVDNPAPANYLLISGDRDFSNALHQLRMRRYNVLLAHAPSVSQALVAAANCVWLWKSLLVGGPPSSCDESSRPAPGAPLLPTEDDVDGICEDFNSLNVESPVSGAKSSLSRRSKKKSSAGAKMLTVAPHKLFDSSKDDAPSSQESDRIAEVRSPKKNNQEQSSQLLKSGETPHIPSYSNGFPLSINHCGRSFDCPSSNLPDVPKRSSSDSDQRQDTMPYHSGANQNIRPPEFAANCRPQFSANSSSQFSENSHPHFSADNSPQFPANYASNYAPNCHPPFSASRPAHMAPNNPVPFSANRPPQFAANHQPQFSANQPAHMTYYGPPLPPPPNVTNRNGGFPNQPNQAPSQNLIELHIRIILHSLRILEAGRVPPTEVNIADCIHFGEINLPDFNVKLGLDSALQRYSITKQYAGAPLPIYTPSNGRPWKWVNIWDLNATHPQSTWNAVHSFLSSSNGRRAMLATQSSYQAVSLLHKHCLHNLVPGEVIQILNLAIKVKRWIVPTFSGWQPLTLKLPPSFTS